MRRHGVTAVVQKGSVGRPSGDHGGTARKPRGDHQRTAEEGGDVENEEQEQMRSARD